MSQTGIVQSIAQVGQNKGSLALLCLTGHARLPEKCLLFACCDPFDDLRFKTTLLMRNEFYRYNERIQDKQEPKGPDYSLSGNKPLAREEAAIMPEPAPKAQSETHWSEQTAQTLARALTEQIRSARLEIDLSSWESQVGAVAAWLEPRIAGKRLVYLGESDHWIQEKYPYRLLFLQALLQLGWDRIGLEMGRADGVKIQRYLDCGEPGCFDRVGLYGANFSQPSVVTSGLFAESRELSGTGGFRSYEHHFFARLRGLIQSVPQSVSFFGFDVDVVPGGAYEDVRARFGKEVTAWPEGLAELTRIESMVPAEALPALESLLKSLKSRRQMLIERLGEATFSAVLQDLQTLLDSLSFSLVAYQNVSLDALFECYAQREATMYRLVEEVLTEPGTRCILMGHNMHLLKHHLSASFGRPPETVNVWDVIGSRLYRRYPDKVMAIWQLCHEGDHSAPLAALPDRIEPRPDTVEALLTEVGEQFIVEIKSEMTWGWPKKGAEVRRLFVSRPGTIDLKSSNSRP